MPFHLQWAQSMKWPDGEESFSPATLSRLVELVEAQKEQGAKTQAAVEQLSTAVNALRQEVRGARPMPPLNGNASPAPSGFGRSCSLDASYTGLGATALPGEGAGESEESVREVTSPQQGSIAANHEEALKTETFIKKWQSTEVFGESRHNSLARSNSLANIESAVAMRMRMRNIRAPPCIVLPNSRGRLVWDVITCSLSACLLPVARPAAARTAARTPPYIRLTPCLPPAVLVRPFQSPSSQSRCRIASRSSRAGA